MYVNEAPPAGAGSAPMQMPMPMQQGGEQDAMKRQMMAQMLRGGGGNGYQQLGNSMGSLLGMLMAQKGGQMPMANGAPTPIAPQQAPQVGPGTGGMY